MSEKTDLRRRVYEQRRELRQLQGRDLAREAAALRAETHVYRKALSNVLYRLDNDPASLDEDTLRSICLAALDVRGVKPGVRRRIQRAHDGDVDTL